MGNIGSNKNYEMLNLRGSFDGVEYLHGLKVPSHRLLISCKGKIVPLQWSN